MIDNMSKVNLTELDDNFQKGTSTFKFENGDQYEGEYCAHRSGMVWREGVGTYITKDGQTYTGEWLDDKLVENKEIEVIFPCGTKYYGNILNNKYTGGGMYVVEENMCLLSEFNENKPVGNIILVDVKGKEWHGTATENDTLLLPEHIYFNNINENRGQGRIRKMMDPMQRDISFKALHKEDVAIKSKESLDKEVMKELEMVIFAKTKKTVSDLKFEESNWYTKYLNFKKVYEDVENKIQENGQHSLDDKEMLWYKKYLDFKKKYKKIIEARKQNKKKSDNKLFELYNTEDYKNSCPPVPVFYPSKLSSTENWIENIEESETETADPILST